MSVNEIHIPEHVRRQLAYHPDFVLKALDSWRATAGATMELATQNFTWLMAASDEDREFYGWEIVAAAVETLEMLASVIRHERSPGTSPFHALDNSALTATFQSLRTESISDGEGCSLLALSLPRGFGVSSVRLAAVHREIVARLQKIISDLAGFWIDNVDNVRWWRHLPMSLTWDESLVISPTTAAARDDVREKIEAIPDRIATFARLSEEKQEIEHAALCMADVHGAMHACDVASHLIVNIASNHAARLRPGGASVRHLFMFLTRGLAEEQRRILAGAGYTLV